MRIPKTINTYCSRCNKHTEHAITLYKAGKRRALAMGERRHRRQKKGYGGQKFPLQKKFSKTTKKQTLKFECRVCSYKRHKDGIRVSKLIIE